MKEFLDAAREHWEKQLGDSELHRIEVSEIGQTIWFKPKRSVSQNAAIMRAYKQGEQEFAVEYLVQLARKEDGTLMFANKTSRDKARDELMRSDHEWITRVAFEMIRKSAPPQSVEDWEGESKATQS